MEKAELLDFTSCCSGTVQKNQKMHINPIDILGIPWYSSTINKTTPLLQSGKRQEENDHGISFNILSKKCHVL